MVHYLTRNWWVLLLRGLAAIVFGVLAFTSPGATLEALVLVYGIYAVFDGVVSLVAGIGGAAGGGSRWMLILSGVVGVAAGGVAFAWPGLTATVLTYIIGFWAIVIGVLQTASAIELRGQTSGGWMVGLSGLISVLFGIVALVYPGTGALAIVYTVGIYALLNGAAMVAAGFMLLNARNRVPATA